MTVSRATRGTECMLSFPPFKRQYVIPFQRPGLLHIVRERDMHMLTCHDLCEALSSHVVQMNSSDLHAMKICQLDVAILVQIQHLEKIRDDVDSPHEDIAELILNPFTKAVASFRRRCHVKNLLKHMGNQQVGHRQCSLLIQTLKSVRIRAAALSENPRGMHRFPTVHIRLQPASCTTLGIKETNFRWMLAIAC